MFAYYIIIVIVVVISCLDNSYIISAASSSIEVDVDGNIVTDDDDERSQLQVLLNNLISSLVYSGMVHPQLYQQHQWRTLTIYKNIAKAIDSTSDAGYDENSKKNDIIRRYPHNSTKYGSI